MTKGDLMQSDSPSGLVMQPMAVTSPTGRMQSEYVKRRCKGDK